MTEIAEELKAFIINNYLQGESPANVRDDTALRSSGILDSIALLALITFIEERFQIEVEAHETDIDNFDNFGDIVAFVARKRATA